MTNPNRSSDYRPDIDGLRAIAVLSVVVFHLNPEWLPGGFTGVDIFFVISGYLITSIIGREMGQGRFSFLAFYKRRILRIAPAYFVVVLVTLAAGWLLMLPQDFGGLAQSALWSTFSLPNAYFWLYQDTGYFADAADQLPLLHLWSLGVEEQYYLIWPLFLLVMSKSFGRRWLIVALSAGALMSFWHAQQMVAIDHGYAYYMLPARAGELLVGSILALALGNQSLPAVAEASSTRWLDEAAALVGLLLIVCGLWLLNGESHFPGWSALLPCLGAALLIFSGRRGGTRIGSFLSWRWMVGIGLISYSLYLWHWPILAFVRYFNAVVDTWMASVCAVVMLAVAWASYRYIELPFRQINRANGNARWTIPSSYVAATIALAGVAFLSVQWTRGERRLGPAPRIYELVERTQAASGYQYNCQVSAYDPDIFKEEKCIQWPSGVENNETVPAILVGDSNAAHYIGVVGTIADISGIAFRNATLSACPPVMGEVGRFGMRGREKDCRAYRADLDKAIEPYDTVILGAIWALYARVPGFWTELERTVSAWTARGKKVVLLGQVPRFHAYDRNCEQRRLRLPVVDCQARSRHGGHGNTGINARLSSLASKYRGAFYLDVGTVLCVDGDCSPYLDDRPVYFDSGHLSMTGSWEIGRRLVGQDGFDPIQWGFPKTRRAEWSAASEQAGLGKPLPRGMFINFRYHLRSDTTSKQPDGQVRRRLEIDYFGQEQEVIVAAIEKMLSEAGYLKRPAGVARTGRLIVYRHRGGGAAIALVRDRRRAEGLSAGARGDVQLDFVE